MEANLGEIHGRQEVGWDVKVRWARSHTTETQRTHTTQHERHVTVGNGGAHDLAKHGASDDRAEFAGILAKDARQARQLSLLLVFPLRVGLRYRLRLRLRLVVRWSAFAEWFCLFCFVVFVMSLCVCLLVLLLLLLLLPFFVLPLFSLFFRREGRGDVESGWEGKKRREGGREGGRKGGRKLLPHFLILPSLMLPLF